jgi:hypothetical protein
MLIFIERDAILSSGRDQHEIAHGQGPQLLGRLLSYEDRKHHHANRTRPELIAEISRDYERSGDAMRYLNAKGQIAWKASPWMLSRLADAEREVQDDMEDSP